MLSSMTVVSEACPHHMACDTRGWASIYDREKAEKGAESGIYNTRMG